jgi:hypothetical protein
VTPSIFKTTAYWYLYLYLPFNFKTTANWSLHLFLPSNFKTTAYSYLIWELEPRVVYR